MLSCLELRHSIESALLPAVCKCTVLPNRTVKVEVYSSHQLYTHVLADGIPIETLSSSRALSDFIGKLKQELQSLVSEKRNAQSHSMHG
jgi:hypothetical protein